jgi:hypothetical protein
MLIDIRLTTMTSYPVKPFAEFLASIDGVMTAFTGDFLTPSSAGLIAQ